MITGVKDDDGDTLPVRVATNKNYELPAMKRKSNLRPRPMPLNLEVTVSGLTPGVRYRLYRYDELAAVPNSHFNAHANSAARAWDIQISSGSTYSMTESIQSDDVAVYRAVRATAP